MKVLRAVRARRYGGVRQAFTNLSQAFIASRSSQSVDEAFVLVPQTQSSVLIRHARRSPVLHPRRLYGARPATEGPSSNQGTFRILYQMVL